MRAILIFAAALLAAPATAQQTYTSAPLWLEHIGGGISALEDFSGLPINTVLTDQYAPALVFPDGNDIIWPASTVDGQGRIRIDMGTRAVAVAIFSPEPVQIFVSEEAGSPTLYVGDVCPAGFCAIYVPGGFGHVGIRDPVSEDQTAITAIYWLDAPPPVTQRGVCFDNAGVPETGQGAVFIFSPEGLIETPAVPLDADGCVYADVEQGLPYAGVLYPGP